MIACGACADTYLIAPSLQLVRAKHKDNRESGIWRVYNWHSHEKVLPVVVHQGGAELLLTALPTATTASKLQVLELLNKIVSVGDGKSRLLSSNAAEKAAASCASIGKSREAGASASAERCRELCASLAEAMLRVDPDPEAAAPDVVSQGAAA